MRRHRRSDAGSQRPTGARLFYSLIYIPLFPLGALFLIIGVGLLPLAPFLSLLATIVMRSQLKEIAAKAPQQSFGVKSTGLLAGIGLALLALCLIELPASLTRYGLQMATSHSPETRSEGIRFLHSFGSCEYLLRSCYGLSGSWLYCEATRGASRREGLTVVKLRGGQR